MIDLPYRDALTVARLVEAGGTMTDAEIRDAQAAALDAAYRARLLGKHDTLEKHVTLSAKDRATSDAIIDLAKHVRALEARLAEVERRRGIEHRGAWHPSTEYGVNDLVSHGGAAWLCTAGDARQAGQRLSMAAHQQKGHHMTDCWKPLFSRGEITELAVRGADFVCRGMHISFVMTVRHRGGEIEMGVVSVSDLALFISEMQPHTVRAEDDGAESALAQIRGNIQ